MNLELINIDVTQIDNDTACEEQTSYLDNETAMFETIVEGKRDSIVESRSYGMVHVISEMMNKMDLSAKKLFGSDDQDSKRIYDFLPCFLATILDPETTHRSRLNRIERNSFFHNNMSLTSDTIRELLEALLFYPPIGDLCDYSSSSEMKSDSERPFTRSNDIGQLQQKLLTKTRAWIQSDENKWAEGVHLNGLMRLVTIASYIQTMIEEQTAMTWDSIYDYMISMDAVKIEHGAKTVLIATRPTSKQLMIFRRLGISSVKSIISERISHIVADDESASNDDDYDHFDEMLVPGTLSSVTA